MNRHHFAPLRPGIIGETDVGKGLSLKQAGLKDLQGGFLAGVLAHFTRELPPGLISQCTDISSEEWRSLTPATTPTMDRGMDIELA